MELQGSEISAVYDKRHGVTLDPSAHKHSVI